jgi:hypothetical protein
VNPAGRDPWALRADRVAGAALVLLAFLVLWESRALPLGSLRVPGPAFVPGALALLLALLGVLVAVSGGASQRLRDLGWDEARHAAAIVAACAFVAFAIERLGYRLTMAVMLFVVLRFVERRGALFAALFAVGLALATHYLFHTVLRVPLPRGPLGL